MHGNLLFMTFFCCLAAEKATANRTNVTVEEIQEQLKKIALNCKEIARTFDEKSRIKALSLVHDYRTPRIKNKFYTGCDELFDDGFRTDGVYRLWLNHGNRYLDVYCDMTTVSALQKRGWITIQRRMNGTMDFDRIWNDYEAGFGFPESEHWIGLRNIEDLLRQKNNYEGHDVTLRFDMVDWNKVKAFAEYDAFRIANKSAGFAVLNVGTFRGDRNLGNFLAATVGHRFTTKKHTFGDHDSRQSECHNSIKGGWWFTCKKFRKNIDVNFNGKYAKKNQRMTSSLAYIRSWQWVTPKNAAFKFYSMKLR